MTCEEAAAQAGAYLDSEAEVGTPIADHVATCPNCARLLAQRRAWRRVVRTAPRFEAPAGLGDRVRAALATSAITASAAAASRRLEAISTTPAKPAVPPTPVRRSTAIAAWMTAVAALILCGVLGLWTWTLMRSAPAAEADLVARDVVASHIRSLMAQHLTDVPSSDRHTVKPWFAGKVPFALAVPDPRAEGFALEGGRLDYVDGRTVAALVYRRHLHAINVFVWPLGAADKPANGPHTQAGYDAIAWVARGQQHWAVSDVNVAELRQFVDLFRRDE
jgi:anti-sigma factor RsiW